MQCIGEFFKKFGRLNDYKPTEDEKEAGLNRLASLAPFGTPLSIARRTNMTPEQILMRPADEAYTIMLVDFEQSEYEKRYRKIQEDNAAMERQLKGR